MADQKIITRFPPSPTGDLHLGGARTALFNWLFARRHGGRFVLRIEDTDRERSTDEATQGILRAMEWLGLDWDEGPYYQSQRMDLYRAYVDRLLKEGKAYWCHCSPELLETKRERAMAEKRKPLYDRTCREKGLGPAPGAVVRLKNPIDGATVYNDRIMGPIRIDHQEMDDLIILRSDNTPTYNLAVVVDDLEMGVNWVIRGQDHINNTPRQILIYQALGAELPEFAHVPMIHGSDGSKLSKRHGATSVMAYQEMGYLPEAMVNCLVRLGWSHGDEEVFGREELVSAFDIANIGKSASIFDLEKLNWLNMHYIKEADGDRLAALLVPFYAQEGMELAPERIKPVLEMFRPRSKTLVEFVEKSSFFFKPIEGYDPKAEKKGFPPEAADILAGLIKDLEQVDFSEEALEEYFRGAAEEKGGKLGVLAQPARLAVTGRKDSPGLFEVLAVLGREETLLRLKQAEEYIRSKEA